jgi:hypothetical protein
MTNAIKNPDDLMAAYPYQFAGKNIGIVFFKGWFQIFSDLCTDINVLLGTEKRGFHWTQAKAKFGVARFYYDIETAASSTPNVSVQQPDGTLKLLSKSSTSDQVVAAIEDLVQKAQDRTQLQCVVCGSPSRVDDYEGLYTVLCDKHSKATKNSDLPLHTWFADSQWKREKWWI